MELGLKGRRVLVTGASQGIGAGLAQAFAGEGCDLFLVARSAERLQQVAGEARALGVNVRAMAVDLTTDRAIDEVARSAGDVDILVNNAGSIPGGTLWDVDRAAWRKGWDLKVFGYIDLTRAIYPVMKQRGSGVILNNIGNGGQNFDFNYIAGTTGNAALMAFTCALGGRSLEDGIRVVGINPGPVDTDRIRKVMCGRAEKLFGEAERYDELIARYPLGRPASVAEVANLFVYLASDLSRYTTGTIVTVDGGIASKRSV
ncbi:SDR family oxidoreductase [Ramlibacter sp.]|uniref:SDR family oxidoreductase n=1 Tax=Ramlibacter sp. TaxID=1917967 RepID=UPI003D130461